MQEEQQNFKNPSALTRWTKRLLYLQVAIAVIAVISGFLEYQLLTDFKNGTFSSQELAISAAESSDNRQFVVGILQMAIYIIAGILILMWIYRANYNARRLGADDMEFTPGWSVGWYFIPIANLWKPYQAMKEIWKASADPQSWKMQSVPSLLPWWWFFWIVSGMLGNASLRLSLRADEINELLTANLVTQASDIIDIPLSLILILIINKIYGMQMLRYSTSD